MRRLQRGNVSVFCRNCELKQCALDHHVEVCSECNEYPCEKLQAFKNDDSPHHSAIFKNLDSLKELGIKKWLENQKNRWSCPQYGTSFSWYDRECEECGHELHNAITEDRDIK
ncbi:MAG: DUF3795 domain-containing protein [Thermotogota bacterium]|nr:DUF3795 domain-containing protein [Thermotogota bacterium]